MNEETSDINQSGKDNLNVGKNFGTINFNQPSNCKLPSEDIIKKFEIASSDLKEHKSSFGKNPDFIIKRNEVIEIEEWLFSDLKPKESQISVVAGQAGYGKSVIMKQLLSSLIDKNIPVLAIKSDKLIANNIEEINIELGFKFSIEELLNRLSEISEKVILIIDQIDALSLSLSANRKPLNTYNRLIKRAINNPNLRVVLSCRIFDLEYDPSLKNYNNLKKFIIDKLSENDVKEILNKLKINHKKLSLSFIEFLRIPLHLEIYSIVYDKKNNMEFNSLQDLYDEYWRQNIIDKPRTKGLNSKTIAQFIKIIAQNMFDSQKIIIDKRLFENEFGEEVNYLLTEEVIVENENENKIQFVHQSFFDYANARSFIEEDKSIFKELLKPNKHQGLFVRSRLKQVLTYQREVQHDKYINELDQLLYCNNLRFHLKLLILNMLGFVSKPSMDEKNIIKELQKKDENLFKVFIESAYENEWNEFLLNELNVHNKLVSSFEDYGNIILQVFIKSLENSTSKVINYLLDIPDFPEKKDFISRLFWFVKDFSDPRVLELFELYTNSNQDHHSYFKFLEKAIIIYPDWVMDKLYEYHKGKKYDSRKSYYSNHYELDTYKKLHEKQLEKAIEFFIKIIFDIDKRSKDTFIKPEFDEYYSTLEFRWYVPHKEKYIDNDLHYYLCDSIIDYLIDKFTTSPKEVLQLTTKLTTNKSLLLHTLILPLFIKNKKELIDEIFNYLTKNNNLFIQFRNSMLYEYYFRELIGASYKYFSIPQKEKINSFIECAVPIEEKTKSYNFQKGVSEKGMNYHGLNKFKMLTMIPEEELKPFDIIYNEYRVLKRKFKNVPNEKPKGIVVTSGETIMSENAYKNMSIADWKKTFVKYQDNDIPPWNGVSETGHCRKFEQLCTDEPQKYFSVVLALIDDSNTPVSPIVYGLTGLTKSNFSSDKVSEIFLEFLDKRKLELDEFSLQMTVWLTSYFIEQDIIMNETIDFLSEIALNQPDKDPLNDDLFSDGINSIRGAAVNRLVKCYKSKINEEKIFSTLEFIAENANTVTRASALWELAFLNNLNKERNLNLFLSLVHDYHPKLLSLHLHDTHPLIYMIHVDFEKLIPFFKKAILNQESHKVISHILLFAWLNNYNHSKELFDEVCSKSIAAKEQALEVAFNNLNDEKSFDKCYSIILKYLNEDVKEIADNYEHAFINLNPKLFDKIFEFLNLYVDSEVGKYRDYNFYHFLQECTKVFSDKDIAEKCIELVKKFSTHGKPDVQRSGITQEPLSVLIDSYSIIREYSTQTSYLEYAMDVFDEMVQIPEYRGSMKRMLNKLDESLF